MGQDRLYDKYKNQYNYFFPIYQLSLLSSSCPSSTPSHCHLTIIDYIILRFIHLLEQYRSNVAYRNANLEAVLESREEASRARQAEESKNLPVPMRRSQRRSPNRPSSETSDSSSVAGSMTHGCRKMSANENACTHEHKQRRLSAIAGLKNLLHVNAKSSDSLSSEEEQYTDEIRPEESNWLSACHRGDLNDMRSLLRISPYLLEHRDFVYGYTALHWASKLGREDIVEFISSQHTDIKDLLDTKSFGGHTALHIAAMCGREQMIVKLLALGADTQVRDHGGRKAKDVVKNTVSSNVQRKLGRHLVIDLNTVLTSGLSSVQHPSKMTRTRAPRFSLAGLTGGDVTGRGSDDAVKKRAKSVGAKHAPTIVLA